MKTGKSVFNSILVFSFLFLSFQSIGQENEELITKSRTLEKEFKNSNIPGLYIINRFGDINIGIWQENYIEMKITVEVTGWDEEEVEIFLEQLFPELTIQETQLSSIINSKHIKDICCPDSKKVYRPFFGKKASVKQFSINYDIRIPETITFIQLNNAYGNISLPSYTGKLIVQLRNGDLKAGNLNLESCNCPGFSIRYGKVNLGDVSNATFNLYSCDFVKISSLTNSTLNTSFSNIKLGSAQGLKLQTKSDAYTIKRVESLEARGQFTTFSIDYLDADLKINNRSGEIEIKEINPDFSSITLDGQFNHYALQVADLNYLFSAKLESTQLECSDKICSEVFKNQAMNGNITINSSVGQNETFSKITLNCTNCNIEFIEE